jgi:hypothetical protein
MTGSSILTHRCAACFIARRQSRPANSGHVLTVVVNGLSRPQQILGAVEELGRRHLMYGVRQEHYATVGAALLWTLQTGLGDALHPRSVKLGPALISSCHPPCSKRRLMLRPYRSPGFRPRAKRETTQGRLCSPGQPNPRLAFPFYSPYAFRGPTGFALNP